MNTQQHPKLYAESTTTTTTVTAPKQEQQQQEKEVEPVHGLGLTGGGVEDIDWKRTEEERNKQSQQANPLASLTSSMTNTFGADSSREPEYPLGLTGGAVEGTPAQQREREAERRRQEQQQQQQGGLFSSSSTASSMLNPLGLGQQQQQEPQHGLGLTGGAVEGSSVEQQPQPTSQQGKVIMATTTVRPVTGPTVVGPAVVGVATLPVDVDKNQSSWGSSEATKLGTSGQQQQDPHATSSQQGAYSGQAFAAQPVYSGFVSQQGFGAQGAGLTLHPPSGYSLPSGMAAGSTAPAYAGLSGSYGAPLGGYGTVQSDIQPGSQQQEPHHRQQGVPAQAVQTTTTTTTARGDSATASGTKQSGLEPSTRSQTRESDTVRFGGVSRS